MATVYGLRKDGRVIYVGSTLRTPEERAMKHWRNRRQTRNGPLASLLADGVPEAVSLAQVHVRDRWAAEAEFSQVYRQLGPLLNMRDGFKHTNETRERIARGMRIYWQKRRGSVASLR